VPADTLRTFRESEADRFTLGREGDAVLSTRPGVTWRSRATVRTSGPTPFNPLPPTYDAPPLSLREHHDVMCLPRRLMYVDGAVLPGSYRFHRRPRLRHPLLKRVSDHVVERPAVNGPVRELPGVYMQLGCPVPGQFGHVLIEQVSHAWGWEEARSRHPGIRALVHAPEDGRQAPWVLDILEAAGVDRGDVELVTGAVRVETLLDTTATFEEGQFVHPLLLETYDRIGAALGQRSSLAARSRRVFHSRRSGRRRCHQQDEIEARFAAAGFEVLHPEDSPLPDQVARARAAEVIAGFAGSNLFHMALTGGPRHVIAITSDAYPAHNEYQMASLLGHRLDLAVGRSDIRRGPTRAKAAFYSPFAFDLDGPEGRFVDEVLAGL